MANWREIVLASATARTDTASDNGGTIAVDPWERALLLCKFTAKGTDVGDTCDVYVDVSPDGGTTFINAVHFTQALGNGTDAATEYAVLYANTPGTAIVVATADAASTAVRPTLFGNALRARWTIVDSGTDDASFTFSVKAYLQ
jgi:hypothetical protein